MKHKIFVILIICFSFSIAQSQIITNVVAKQDGNKVVITYNLQSNFVANISLYVSERGDGIFTGPLKSVTGDVGNNITSGSKTIIWNTLQDQDLILGDNIVFRVIGSKFGTFTDNRDGKTYKTVNIGYQTMMAENLSYKANSSCLAYDNNESNVAKYGYLYDRETAKNICPTGWHLPDKEEFETLLQNIGGNSKNAYNALLPGGNSGFSALFGGCHLAYDDRMEFLGIESAAHFWSNSKYLFSVGRPGQDAYLTNIFRNVKIMVSVRCFKDN